MEFNKNLQINADDGKNYTAEDIVSRSIRIAVTLKSKYNLTQNDVVGIMSANSANVMSLFYACLYSGFPVNAVDTSFNINDVIHIWSKTRPKIVFCENRCYNLVKDALKEVGLESEIVTLDTPTSNNIVSIEDILPSPNPQSEFFYKPLDVEGTHTAIILISSGTSGLPKTVGLTHREILLWFKSRHFSMRDTSFNYSTLYWISGVTTYLNAAILGMAMVVTKSPFTPESCLKIIQKFKVNVLSVPPWFISQILTYEKLTTEMLSSIYVVVSVGAVPAIDHRKKLFDVLPQNALLLTGYGMTEMSKATCLLQFNSMANSETLGHVSPHVKIRIIDENKSSVGPCEQGEILIKNKYTWEGYYNDPESTRNALDSDGWYHSGDIGYFDKNGCLCFVGRKKEILKVFGYHVSPMEVEKVILQLQGISEVCVFGIRDDFTANRLYAAVVRSKLIENTISAEEISNHMEKELSSHKRIKPENIYFVDKFPRTSTGKIMKREVVKMFEEKLLVN